MAISKFGEEALIISKNTNGNRGRTRSSPCRMCIVLEDISKTAAGMEAKGEALGASKDNIANIIEYSRALKEIIKTSVKSVTGNKPLFYQKGSPINDYDEYNKQLTSLLALVMEELY